MSGANFPGKNPVRVVVPTVCTESPAQSAPVLATRVPSGIESTIKELAELGWPQAEIAAAVQMSADEFSKLLVDSPDIAAMLGYAVESFTGYSKKRSSWRPRHRDLAEVRRLAALGYTENGIAAKLEVTRACFSMRLADTPPLKDAMEQGHGEYVNKRINEWNEMLDYKDTALKTIGAAFMFTLKCYGGLNDRPETHKVEVSGAVEHKHSVLNAPKPVAIADFAQAARIEMKRATEVSAEQLRLVQPIVETIEVEAREVAE